MSKMSKIDQIHLMAVMLYMSKMSKIDQIHLTAVIAMYVEDGKKTCRHIFYHTFLNVASFECNAIYVKDVEDRSNTPKGCNAMYVEDGKRTYTHILAHNFLNI